MIAVEAIERTCKSEGEGTGRPHSNTPDGFVQNTPDNFIRTHRTACAVPLRINRALLAMVAEGREPSGVTRTDFVTRRTASLKRTGRLAPFR